MQNPIILGLKSDIIRLEGKLQEAGRNQGKNHPQYQSTEIEIETLKKKLDFETQQVLTSINTANRVNKERGSELQASILSHKKQAIEQSADRDQIAVLENDVETAQRAYDLLVQRYTETNLQSQSNQTNISVLTPATEPLNKSSPNVYKNMLIAVFAGTILGVMAAFVAEMLDQRVRTSESLAAATGVPVLVYFTEKAEPLSLKRFFKKIAGFMRLKPKLGKTVLAN